MHKLKITGSDGLERDTGSHAVINNNSIKLNSYLRQRKILETAKAESENLSLEITNLKGDLESIRGMLLTLMDGNKNNGSSSTFR